ncbi:hypothetical protein WKI68_08205 [Streptomyces sp. MS1.HAVA.3]|uniref:Uncharacterized protein n=1 Tax=Streptomyces caledonius TaxID=3134107 RepID=A0ABU8U0S4_9ACTN
MAAFLAITAFSATYDSSLNEMLPVYCGIILGLALGLVGHWKALRAFMTWRAENPGKPDDEGPGVPWMLQMAFTLPWWRDLVREQLLTEPSFRAQRRTGDPGDLNLAGP